MIIIYWPAWFAEGKIRLWPSAPSRRRSKRDFFIKRRDYGIGNWGKIISREKVHRIKCCISVHSVSIQISIHIAISGLLPHRHLRPLPRPRLPARRPHRARLQQRGNYLGRSSSGNKNKRAVVVQLMSACVCLWIRVAIQLAKIWLEFWLEKRLEIPFWFCDMSKHVSSQNSIHFFRHFLSYWIGKGIAVQWSPLVRSAFCPMKIDHTSGPTFNPGCKLLITYYSWWLAQWDEHFRARKRRILLLPDNCSAHLVTLTNIEMAFLPPPYNGQNWFKKIKFRAILSFKWVFWPRFLPYKRAFLTVRRACKLTKCPIRSGLANNWPSKRIDLTFFETTLVSSEIGVCNKISAGDNFLAWWHPPDYNT